MSTYNDLLTDPEIRRVYEEEVLLGEATATVAGMLESLGLSQAELARRLGVTPGRVSQILSGHENIGMRTLGALGWALGVRFELQPVPMADRAGTPAVADPPAPAWLSRLGPQPTVRFAALEPKDYSERDDLRPALRVLGNGRVAAA